MLYGLVHRNRHGIGEYKIKSIIGVGLNEFYQTRHAKRISKQIKVSFNKVWLICFSTYLAFIWTFIITHYDSNLSDLRLLKFVDNLSALLFGKTNIFNKGKDVIWRTTF